MRSLKRTELRIDGREDRDVYMPMSCYAGDRSPCVGTLLAVYVGKPLTSKELPTDIDFGDGYLATNGATFPTKRVADSELSPPSAPNVCGPNGKPTADPSATPAPGASTVPSFRVRIAVHARRSKVVRVMRFARAERDGRPPLR
jgi:hypothetical protein